MRTNRKSGAKQCTALDCVRYTILTTALPFPFADIMIYDEESDRHVHIPFLQALFATCYGHDSGPQEDLFGLATLSPTDGQKYEFHKAAVAAEIAANKRANLVQSPSEMGTPRVGIPDDANAWRTLGTNITGAADAAAKQSACLEAAKAVAATVINGVWCPAEIVIARPFIEHLMLSAIVTVAGRDTGATLFGPADMQISANTSVKTIEGYACLLNDSHRCIF